MSEDFIIVVQLCNKRPVYPQDIGVIWLCSLMRRWGVPVNTGFSASLLDVAEAPCFYKWPEINC